jgi:hypothetical protein
MPGNRHISLPNAIAPACQSYVELQGIPLE